jgi:hypothetical protein
MRWTTGIGIAVGGVGGAIAALMGAPHSPAPPSPVTRAPHVEPAASPAAAASTPEAPPVVEAPPAPAENAPPSASASASASAISAAGPAPLAMASAVSPAAGLAVITPAPLDIPKTREALLKAELYCDQKKDFDECARAALALETGTTAPPDAEQGKRFRRIALTHLVMQCESASAHACFVLAAKYRAGSELAKNDTSAEALEKRGLELCRLGNTAPECPAP